MTLQVINVGNTSIIIGADGGFTVMPGGEKIDVSLDQQQVKASQPLATKTNGQTLRFEKVFGRPGATKHEAVIDHHTGLMWSIESIGDPDDADDGITQEHCTERCRELRLLGYDDWRLPTRTELVTLIDDTRHDPAIDSDLFPGVKPRWHWTSTPSAWSASVAWLVHFYYGFVYGTPRFSNGFALACRRAGQ